MELYRVVFLLSLTTAAISRKTVLTDESGHVSLGDGNNFLIRVPKGRKIAVEISSLNLRSGSLKVKDGRDKVTQILQNSRGSIKISPEDRSTAPKAVSLPFRFQTATRKLHIDARALSSARGEHFSLRYISYTDDGTCKKARLQSKFSDAEITCDSDALVPVATSCDVTLQCDENYKQYSKNIDCLYGRWEGNTQCLPKTDLIEACSFNLDEINGAVDCPFSDNEVEKYYTEVEDVSMAFESSLGRSNNRRVDCSKPNGRGNVCSKTNRRWNVSCNPKTTLKWLYYKCFVCRRRRSCGRRSTKTSHFN